MGTVRITQERGRAYKSRAMDLFDKANPEPDFTPEEKTEIAERFQRHPMQLQMAEFHSKMANQFSVEMTDRLPFNISFFKQDVEHLYCRASEDDHKVMCSFDVSFEVYAGRDSYWNTDHKTTFIPDKFCDDPVSILKLQRAIRRVETERDARVEKRARYESNITAALQNANTLGQLIKMWPQAKELATQEELRKLHTKETRVQAAKRIREEIDLDTDLLNSEVLTANLLGD